MSTPRQILIDALRSVWTEADPSSLAILADQLLRGQSATLGTSTASLTLGQDNDFSHATISIGTIAGRDVIHLSLHFPQPINPALPDPNHDHVVKAARHVESERLLALRLEGFVGRDVERTAIRTAIDEIRPTGGYVVVKAHAGEGKSSIIAKLIDEAGVAATPYHFIAMTPGREYHLSLLRTLVAQLILKCGLDTGYFPDESYPAMKDLFAAVLRDIAAQGHAETLYLDGLDQLEPELSGVRDLSFLPPQPPPGMVIVLGTRPDDTLRPLEPLHKLDYWLPKLTQTDFTALLQTRTVYLPSTLVTDLYAALDGNALYLTLAAMQLHHTAQANIAGLVRTITANPGSLFTVTLDRIRRSHERLWERVIYPVLGILLVSQEPLRAPILRTLLQVTADDLRQGLDRLGGLVSQSADGAFSLYHLKFREYLAEPAPDASARDFLFSQDEVVAWHQHLATWCLPNDAAVDMIWQPGASAVEDERWYYARHHAITHLAEGQQYDRLWSILEDGRYGRHKRRFDPSTRLYALDLDRARDVAAATDDLIRLWRWSLLQINFTSQIDAWPDALFHALVHLGRGSEALSRAELLSNPSRKGAVLQKLAPLFDQSTAQRVWDRALVTAITIRDDRARAAALRTLAQAQTQAQRWEDAATTAATIPHDWTRAEALSTLAQAQAQAQHPDAAATFSLATSTATAIQDDRLRTFALRDLVYALVEAQRWDEATTTAVAIPKKQTRAEALRDLAEAMAQAQRWDEATTIVAAIPKKQTRALAFRDLVHAMVQAQRWDEATTIVAAIARDWTRTAALRDLVYALAQAQRWDEATTTVAAIPHDWTRAAALRDLAQALAQAQRWDEATTTVAAINDDYQRAEALRDLALAMTLAQHADAATTVALATTAAATLNNDWTRAAALRDLAQALAQSQRWDEATTTVAAIPHDWTRAKALRTLAQAMAQAQRWDEATTTVAAIPHDWTRAAALRDLAQALAQAGLWTEAQTTIAAIIDEKEQDQALRDLAQAFTQAQRWDEATTTVAVINDDWTRDEALRTLACAQARAGRWDEATTAVTAIARDWTRAAALRDLAEAMAQAQRWDEATSTAATIPHDRTRALAFSDLTLAMAQTQHPNAAATFVLATSTAAAIPHDKTYAAALRDLALAMAQAQHPDAAATFTLATTAATALNNAGIRAVALRALAQAMIQTQRWEEAATTIAAIARDRTRAEALRDLAEAQAQAQRWDEATATVAAIPHDRTRAEALRDLAEAQAQAQHRDAAATVALTTIAATFNDDYQRADLHDLHVGLLQAGNTLGFRQGIAAAWRGATTRDKLLTMTKLAHPLITHDPALGRAMVESFAWVDIQLRDT